MSEAFSLIFSILHIAAAATGLSLAAWLIMRRERFPETAIPFAVALTLSSLWSILTLALGVIHPLPTLAISATYLAWLWVLYRLFSTDGRLQNTQPIRPVVLVLATIELVQPVLILVAPQFALTPDSIVLVLRIALLLKLLFVIGALVLVHNLYVGASATSRQLLRWPASALAAVWLYDLHCYTLAYLTSTVPLELAGLRGGVALVVTALAALTFMSGSEKLRVQPSRAVTFQTFSLLVIGGYLLAMIGVVHALSWVGGDFGRVMQTGFITVMTASALLLAMSHKMRGWLRVTMTKHLFQHRFDYRSEWLRFNKTIGRGGANSQPLHERAVQALADITESQSGVLLLPGDDNALKLGARWQWSSIEVPGEAIAQELVQFVESNQYIVNIEDLRAGRDDRLSINLLPQWLIDEPRAWILVPLIHFEKLVGAVVLAQPPFQRELDWEDFDLLGVVGQQLASYLAEQSGQEALGEASRFDEFNRRIAFVMHDIKNLASQMSLLARNAEKHADNPEFRADMLVTLRNSADKLNALLARLNRYGAAKATDAAPVELSELVVKIAKQFVGQHPVTVTQSAECIVQADREGLDQALTHLVQNAIDASDKDTPVFLNVVADPLQGRIEVIDSGSGMSADFVRNGLFRPFHSTKEGGFGIGAYEAREIIRAMEGRIDVESREGLGTRFVVRLPLAETAAIMNENSTENADTASKVA